MLLPPHVVAIPTLPQQASLEERQQRQLKLRLARPSYNYMRSDLEAVPMSADLPKGEEFSLDFEAKVVAVFIPLAPDAIPIPTSIADPE